MLCDRIIEKSGIAILRGEKPELIANSNRLFHPSMEEHENDSHYYASIMYQVTSWIFRKIFAREAVKTCGGIDNAHRTFIIIDMAASFVMSECGILIDDGIMAKHTKERGELIRGMMSYIKNDRNTFSRMISRADDTASYILALGGVRTVTHYR